MSGMSVGSGPGSVCSMVETSHPEARIVATEMKTTHLGYKVINGRLIRFSVEQTLDDTRAVHLSAARRSEAIHAASSLFEANTATSDVIMMETGDVYTNGVKIPDQNALLKTQCQAKTTLTASKTARLATSVLFTEKLEEIDLDDDMGSDCSMEQDPIYSADFETTFAAAQTYYIEPSAPPYPTLTPGTTSLPGTSVCSMEEDEESLESRSTISDGPSLAPMPAPASGSERSSQVEVEPISKRPPSVHSHASSMASSYRPPAKRASDIASVSAPVSGPITRPHENVDEDDIRDSLTSLINGRDLNKFNERDWEEIFNDEYYKEAAMRQGMENRRFDQTTVQSVVASILT